MSRSGYLLSGIFGSFAVSCVALVFVPQLQIGGLTAHIDEENNDAYPVVNTRQGRAIYIREGCYYCHSQQIRDPQNSTDIERGWGSRRSVARDFIYDSPPVLGSMRIGPDLANVGANDWRNEAADETVKKPVKRDAHWHLLHLYEPTAIVSESNMPPYRYFFTRRKVGAHTSPEAVRVSADEGYEIVPTAEGKQLVAYLLSLDRSHPLPESSATGAPAVAPAAPPAPAAAPPAPAPGPPVAPPTPAK